MGLGAVPKKPAAEKVAALSKEDTVAAPAEAAKPKRRASAKKGKASE
jgi:hypothetical protein